MSGGTASTSVSVAVGSHLLSAKFLPTNPGTTNPVTDPTPAFGPSNSAGAAYQVNNPAATATATALSVNTGTGAAFSPVAFTATVTPSNASGTVSFTDGTTVLDTTTAGTGTFSFTDNGLAQGNHSVTATFNPSAPAQYGSSTSTPTVFNLNAPTYAPAVGNLQASVPTGTLIISTPFTSSAPLNLGALALNANGTQFSGQIGFGSAGSDAITVTDTRSGDLPWTVSAEASNLSSGPTNQINGENVGLTGVTPDPLKGNALTAGSVTVADNPAATPTVSPTDTGSAGLGGGVVHTVASAAQGNGSIGLYGTITVNAPTSTPPGTYAGTITFTIG